MEKSKELARRLLVILDNDTKSLHERIVERKDEYISFLSLHRSREHFKKIFRSVYHTISIENMLLLTEELLVSVNKFYRLIEKYEWYLMHTEDQPSVVENVSNSYVKDISSQFSLLSVFLEAELNTASEPLEKFDREHGL